MLSSVKAKEVIATIINAIDIINPILKNHHRRTAIIAYHLGKEYNLSEKKLAELVVAATFHDVGALTIKDNNDLMNLDVKNPHEHAFLGSGIFASYKAFDSVSKIIKHHHIKYTDYNNQALNVDTIPFEALILHLADRIEILLDRKELSLNQVEPIKSQILELSASLFDPELVDTFIKLSRKEYFWFDIDTLTSNELLDDIDMDLICTLDSPEALEELVYTLSKIIDYKCSFTSTHSIGVANVTYKLARLCGLDDNTCNQLKIAGYLHDIGKIAVPSEIISKSGNLTVKEFNVIKSHPYFTYQILKHIKGFEKIAFWASSHHETIDETGYPRKPDIRDMNIEIEVLSYADIFTALCEDRPYRQAIAVNKALEIIDYKFRDKVGDNVYSILKEHAYELNLIRAEVQANASKEYQHAIYHRNQ